MTIDRWSADMYFSVDCGAPVDGAAHILVRQLALVSAIIVFLSAFAAIEGAFGIGQQ